MPRQTRADRGQQNMYAQQLDVSLAPSPMYPQARMPMPTNNNSYYNMPNNATSPAMQMAPQHQQPLPQAAFEGYASTTAPPVNHLPQSHRPSSGAWTPQDDRQLMLARSQGLNWNQIKETHFPTKTPNACRKRHERLAERRDADDWDTRKFQVLARKYMDMRKEIWSGLAQEVGEKWNVVESKCMSNGIKNIQSAARAAARHQSQSAVGGPITGYDDDSGISGIGLTPVDELDASYSSPETSSSGGRHSVSSRAASHGYGPQHPHQIQHQHPHHAQLQSHPNAHLQVMPANGGQDAHYLTTYGMPNGQYGEPPQHHRYSSSISSNASGGNPYANGGCSSGSSSPYMRGQRLPSVDMGIGAIIHRPGGGGGAPGL